MRCGVLALQGDWAAHIQILQRLGVAAVPVRTAAEIERVQALVLPGGESTAMLRLMEPEALDRVIAARIRDGMPVLATCAGVILLADGVRPDQRSLGLLDADVVRNAYGRQLDSAVMNVRLAAAMGPPPVMEGVFIRAPRIVRIGDAVQVLAWRDHDPVLVRQGHILAATFHPELTDDERVHQLLAEQLARPR